MLDPLPKFCFARMSPGFAEFEREWTVFPTRSTVRTTSPHNVHSERRSFRLRESHASGTFDDALRSFMAPASISSRRNQILEWFPFYVHRLVGDVRYRALKDYQQAWYLNLLFAAWVSERPGYLPDDGQLWRLANARTRQFFEKEFEPVMRMFEREGPTTDGAVWIYQPLAAGNLRRAGSQIPQETKEIHQIHR